MVLPVLLILAFLLSACGSTSGPQVGGERHRVGYQAGRPSYKIGPPYRINGVWYYPKVDYGYEEDGTASWYGPGFDRKVTANGEIYDMNQLTAAHKTLPLPSVVEVTNRQNGRSLQLRVNDRGPYVGDRVIDVSRRAAQLLGFEGAGTAPVRVRILREPSIQVAQAAMRGEFGDVRVAEATSPARAFPAPPPVQRVARAETPLPRSTPVAPPPAARTEVVAANWPAPEPPRQAEIAVAPVPEPPPRPAQIVAAPPPEPAGAPPQMASASRRSFPSLISQAHAETLRAPIPAAASATGSGRIYVQAGAFSVPENAQRARSRIASLGNAEIVPSHGNGNTLYRVRLGPVASEAEASRLRGKVVDSGFPDARIVGD
jgi:peptidoglycan lytic transglycosylase